MPALFLVEQEEAHKYGCEYVMKEDEVGLKKGVPDVVYGVNNKVGEGEEKNIVKSVAIFVAALMMLYLSSLLLQTRMAVSPIHEQTTPWTAVWILLLNSSWIFLLALMARLLSMTVNQICQRMVRTTAANILVNVSINKYYKISAGW